MTPAQTIGILGGTFNPVHIGHLRLATAVAEALRLKHVDLMPCAVPPHKADSGLLSFEMRVFALAGRSGTPQTPLPMPGFRSAPLRANFRTFLHMEPDHGMAKEAYL